MSRIYNRRKNLFPDGIKSPLSLVQSSVYVTQLHLGEGDTAYSPYVILDTGAELTWVQCESCNPCFELDQKFAYKKSTSFRRVSVNDELCAPRKSYGGSCGFSLLYGDIGPLPEATGLLGRETFYFKNSRTNNMDAYQGLAFGCTLKSKNIQFGPRPNMHGNVVAGVFGLTSKPKSLLTQLDAQTHGRFFYCIPPIIRATLIESTIYFGDDAQITGDATRQVQTIPMKSGFHYYLPLSGISVNNKRLPIDPSIFEYVGDGKKGLLIDSGSAFSALQRSAYNPLRQAIEEFFLDAYGWLPRSSRQALAFDLCYAIYPGYNQKLFPNVVLHFSSNDQVGEIDMVLGKEQLFTEVEDDHGQKQGFCMTITVVDDPNHSVLGSFQQVNFGFLYDVYNSRLSFVPQNCLENIL
ncbi:aspartic proteinase nepenthesin-1-like [Silene latifolia]|uniref:aspartic proteinase nepenthesin-1-like n=1 Tax=Silene latifolia TaxID=37657 RepID=UPI003D7716D5